MLFSQLKHSNKHHAFLNAMQSSMQDVTNRLNYYPNMNANWRNKFHQSMIEMSKAVQLENYYNANKSRLQNFNQYKSFRIYSAGIPLCLRFIELYNSNQCANTDDNNDTLFNHDIAVISSIDNDLLSYKNEDTCTILDFKNKINVQKMRNNLMKNTVTKHRLNGDKLNDDDGNIYKEQSILLSEGAVRFQLNAKRRYIQQENVVFNHCDNLQQYKYYDDIINLYTPNILNYNFKEYHKKYKAILQDITNTSYEFALKHDLLQNDEMDKIWKSLDVGHFCYCYPLIQPNCKQNLYLLQIICDFIGCIYIFDDVWEFCDDDLPFNFYQQLIQQL